MDICRNSPVTSVSYHELLIVTSNQPGATFWLLVSGSLRGLR